MSEQDRQRQLKLRMRMAEAEAADEELKSTKDQFINDYVANPSNLKKTDFRTGLGSNDWIESQRKSAHDSVENAPDAVRAIGYGLPFLGPFIPDAERALGADDQADRMLMAKDKLPLMQIVGSVAGPNPLGFAGMAGRLAGGTIDAAKRGYDNDGLEGAGLAGGTNMALQGAMEVAAPAVVKGLYKAAPGINKAGNDMLSKFLGIEPQVLAKMSQAERDELMLALGMPKYENQQQVRPAALSKFSSRQNALDSITGLEGELGNAKNQVIESLPPVQSNDVADTLDTWAQNPMVSKLESESGAPSLNEMSSRYREMGDFVENPTKLSQTAPNKFIGGAPGPAGAVYNSNPVPMSMLAKDASELGGDIGSQYAKSGLDEIINTTAGEAGKLEDLNSANYGLSRAGDIRHGLNKVMSNSTEGMTTGLSNKLTAPLERGFNAVGGQRLISATGLGAKDLASKLLNDLPKTQMMTPDMSKFSRILQVIQGSSNPDVDMEIAVQTYPDFNRYLNESREKNVGN